MMQHGSFSDAREDDVFMSALTLHLSIVIVLEALARSKHHLSAFNTCDGTCKTKITDLYTAILVHKDVRWFKVTMQNVC